ncbi:retrovirus-related pol polyprotein from transposon TNT 1-94 [Tanacetum coccineum]
MGFGTNVDNCLSEYLLKEGYKNDSVCPCIFIKRSGYEYVIIAVYVDDLNIIGTLGELPKAIECLKREFEMKDLGKTKFCLGLQIEHLKDGILVHQEAYIEKLLKRFYMDKSHSLSTPMVVRTLDVKKDPFRPRDDEEILGPEVPYLSAIGALMFLVGHTRPDITFSLNLLARYSSCPTRRHWNGVKHIFRYLQGTKDMGLYFTNPSNTNLVGFADAGYMSDPHNGISQTGYVFTSGGTAISWRSVKQTIANEAPTILYEDNATCIAQLKEGYIKGDRTKNILPKFFFTHDLQKNGDIIIQQVRSSDNLVDLFTKALPTSTFRKLSHNIGMHQLKDLKMEDQPNFDWTLGLVIKLFVPGFQDCSVLRRIKTVLFGIVGMMVGRAVEVSLTLIFFNLLNLIDSVQFIDGKDEWIWNLDSSNTFVVNSTRQHIDSLLLPQSQPRTRWYRFIPKKVNIFLWRAFRNRLPTRLNLSNKSIETESLLCPVCSSFSETVDHILASC